jgi:hypothetical protein
MLGLVEAAIVESQQSGGNGPHPNHLPAGERGGVGINKTASPKMPDQKRKQEIITFKADEPLCRAMLGIPNRSEFIRAAILSALDSVCPLCKGSGILTPDQRKHWVEFAEKHAVEECADCHAVHLVCEANPDGNQHQGA